METGLKILRVWNEPTYQTGRADVESRHWYSPVGDSLKLAAAATVWWVG